MAASASSRDRDLFSCTYCNSFSAFSMLGVLRHVGRVHSNDPGFHIVCGINECPRTFKKYYSFRKHVRRCHKDALTQTNITIQSEVDEDPEEEGINESNESALEPAEKRIRSSALFLLKAKEIDRINQNSLESIIGGVTTIVEETLDEVKARIRRCSFLTDDSQRQLAEIINDPGLRNPFLSFHSEFRQRSQYKRLFNLVVSVEYTYTCS